MSNKIYSEGGYSKVKMPDFIIVLVLFICLYVNKSFFYFILNC